MEENIKVLKKAEATVVEVNLPTLREFGDAEFEVLLYEFKAGLNKYLADRGGKYRTLQDLIEFNQANKDKEMPYFGQDIFIKAQQKGDLEEREYRLALLQSKVLTQERGIDAIIDKEKLDALIAPSNAQSWMIDLINGDSPTNYVSSSSMPAVSGYPNITVPAGFISEMPIGLSFWGKAFTEEKLIKLAYAFEQTTNARRKPKFLATYA
jgi:amidase